jgi:putative PEP-CTERM system histidine kinase
MSPFLFVILSVLANVLLCVVVLFRNYKFNLAFPLLISGILIPLSSFWGVHFIIPLEIPDGVQLKIFFLLNILSAVSLIFLNSNVMHKRDTVRLSNNLNKFTPVSLTIAAAIMAIVMVFCIQFEYDSSVDRFLNKSFLFSTVILIIIGLFLYATFLLENTYRFAKEYQRRIARLFFIPMGIMLVYSMFYFTSMYLYHNVNHLLLETGLIIQGISFPVMLIGFFKYRLSYEQVMIPRNTVYTSFSLLLTGAAFLAIGLTSYLFKVMHIDFKWFESTLIFFTCSFLLFLLLSSGNMRRRIILFVNRNFYSNKYDYRDQFFRLHQAYVYGANLDESVVNLVENMKYAVAATNAFVFLRDPHNNSYSMKKNPEFSSDAPVILQGNDPIVLAFEHNSEPLDLVYRSHKEREQKVLASMQPAIQRLSPSVIFPIPYNDATTGFLLIDISSRELDTEDKLFVKAFAQAIGSTCYKSFQQQEKIEVSQFQSFNQVVSFVVHDIKNQIATLSLLAKNADTLIDNPEFQKSLTKSIKTCSDNLSSLVEKLSSSRNGITMSLQSQEVLPILENIANCAFVNSLKEIQVQWIEKKPCSANVDVPALEKVFFNLIKNGIEAMGNNGTLRLYCAPPSDNNFEITRRFNLPPSAIQNKNAIIMIEDTGYGMTKNFLETRLFKPFETTKDKGIGIGLYQCKIYIEKMNGVLLCNSELQRGTAFCIIL